MSNLIESRKAFPADEPVFWLFRGSRTCVTTTAHAARHLGVAWDTIRDIEARHLEKHYSRPRLKHLKRLAIDEIHLGKSVKFLTVVLDLDSGAIMFVGRGKGEQALDPFW